MHQVEAAEMERMALQGMLPAFHAARAPGAVALHAGNRTVTFADLNARANRLANVLAGHGLQPGDSVAMLCGNTPEFFECYLACIRSGLRLTPVSTQFGTGDAAYVISNCDARVLVVHARQLARLTGFAAPAGVACYVIGGEARGFASYDAALALASDDPPAAPRHGKLMLYTSGTTGRPKGVHRKSGIVHRAPARGTPSAYRAGDVNLLCGAAYHSAPLYFDVILPMASGVPVVLMEKFDAEEALKLIERHRVSHTFMAPVMFQRLLRLPVEVRRKYDLSSLRVLNHGGAPTPVEVKRQMIDWLGPVLREFYAATEGTAGIAISSEEWLRKPGSVGRLSERAAVLDDEDRWCKPGVVGRVHFRKNECEPSTEYYRDAAETRRVFGRDWFSVGDVGYVDEDGYLFLTGRSSDRIVSGGVNIHPQEIDDVLMSHPSVRAACCVGAPNEEWGEEVRAVVVAEGASDALAGELIELVRAKLSPYKAPRGVDFVEELPVSEAGKLQRAAVRATYWQGRALAI